MSCISFDKHNLIKFISIKIKGTSNGYYLAQSRPQTSIFMSASLPTYPVIASKLAAPDIEMDVVVGMPMPAGGF